MKQIGELINLEDSGFAQVKEWMQEAQNEFEVLPCELTRAENALYNTQVTTHSPMGAIIYETGGILIKSGWLRILGSGHPKLNRSLPDWNKGKAFEEYGEQPAFLLVADDVLGGFFALNAGGLSPDELGCVFYFAPDTMEWESTELTYSEFLYWCFNGDLDLYYKVFFWDGYESDLQNIPGTQAMSFFPFLWTEEGRDINECTRKVIEIEEIWNISMNNQKNK